MIKPPMTGPLATAKALNAPITAVTLLVFAFPKSAILIGKTIGVKIAFRFLGKIGKQLKNLANLPSCKQMKRLQI